MEENYITILIQSLEKKLSVLEEVSSENQKERQILLEEELDLDAFQAAIDRKAQLIEQIGFLDDGFEKLYEHVKDTLNQSKQTYEQEIIRLKELISQITELTVSIQKEELDNRDLAEQHFSGMKKKTRQMKTSKQVATQYYQNMAKLNVIEPQFMDKKK